MLIKAFAVAIIEHVRLATLPWLISSWKAMLVSRRS